LDGSPDPYFQEIYLEAARAEVINLINNFFCEKLNALPSIKVSIDELQAELTVRGDRQASNTDW